MTQSSSDYFLIIIIKFHSFKTHAELDVMIKGFLKMLTLPAFDSLNPTPRTSMIVSLLHNARCALILQLFESSK